MDPTPAIRTPDERVRVFVSSTLGELAEERAAVRDAVTSLRLTPVLFELGARPHPPRELYRAYLRHSDVFVGLYWQRYGWVAPDETVSGLEDEYRLADQLPKLLYIKEPAPDREPRLERLLADIKADDTASYRRFATPDHLRRLVADDLAVVLSERFAATASRPPAPAAAPPAPLTPLIDRDAELAAATRILRAGRRLVTVTGTGGIGKTRLAVEIARKLAADYRDGAAWVPLATVTDASRVIPTIAERLGVRVEGTREPLDALVDHLTNRQMLIMLDNLEQVADAGVDLAHLLARAPDVRLVVTSRRPLGVRGEQELQLGPLTVPAPDAAPADASATGAVQLLADRASAVRSGFALSDNNLGPVAELARRLDGIPLALELAAAQLRVFDPTALLQRLADPLELHSAATDIPERQRTLRATLDRSYDLLDDRQRRLFAHLGVFLGGATVDAVEAVSAPDVPAGVMDTLADLVRASLVTVADDTVEPRVTMLETVRSYARERLEHSGEAADLRARHFAWFCRLGRQAQPYLCGPGQRDWAARLDPDRPNLRAAIDTGFRVGRIGAVLQLVWDTFVYFYIRDAFDEPRTWITRIAETAAGLDPVDCARLDVGRAIVGDVTADVPALDAARAVLSAAGLAFEVAVTDHYRGLAHWQAGDADAAVTALDTSSRGYDALGHDWGVAITETTLGAIHAASGHPETAAGHHQRSLHHATRIDNRPLMCQARQGLALVDALTGRHANAAVHLREAVRIARDEASAAGAAACLEALAAALLDDDIRAATVALAVADDVRRRLGIPAWTATDVVVAPLIAAARARLDTYLFDDLWRDGAGDDPFELLDRELPRLHATDTAATPLS